MFDKIISAKEQGKVRKIIKDVQENGDEAVQKYSRFFDKVAGEGFFIDRSQVKMAYQKVSPALLKAIKAAARNIRRFALLQMKQLKNFEYKEKGIILGQRVTPIETIGVYVPGGKYPLFSSALMGIIPAKVAGAKKIIVCSPKIKPEVIVAADIAGANMIFNVGGAQAMAALSFGTKVIPRVDKIIGPGNIYVAFAKKELFGNVGIDLIAGPSELLIIADKTANPDFIAADLLAQAEHDEKAETKLISVCPNLISKVKKIIEKENCSILLKKQILNEDNFTLVNSVKDAIVLANIMAPEHLALMVKKPKQYLSQLKNYGSLFLGDYSAVVFGDYCSGTNHILPTSQTARFQGGLSVRDFVKIQTYQKINRIGMKKLSKTAKILALSEGLLWHKKSIMVRNKNPH